MKMNVCALGLFVMSIAAIAAENLPFVAADSSTFTKKKANEYVILFKGNSITRHHANEWTKKSLGWNHIAGMAASSEDKDYAHILAGKIQKAMPGKSVRIVFGQGNTAALKSIGKEKEYQADFIVFQGGEHVTPKNIDEYPSFLEKVLTALKKFPGAPAVLAVGVWSPTRPVSPTYSGVLDIQKQVCEKCRVPLAVIFDIAEDPRCSGSGASPGVKWHPNDIGMEKIADRIYSLWEKNCFRK